MNRDEFTKFAEAWVDGEFDAAEEAEIKAHLAQCPESAQLATDLQSFKQLLESQAGQDRAPAHLRQSVVQALDRSRPNLFQRWTYGIAAAAAVALILILNLFRAPEPEAFSAQLITDPILDASVDWHRSNLPIEVTGPDTDVIREWFVDKVDFPVRLPSFDATAMNSSVLGGRLSHLNNQRAAQVLYEVEGAKVTVLLFETSTDLHVPRRRANSIRFQPFQGNRQGYNVALFENNGVTYAITTELPQDAFQDLLSNVQFAE